MPFKPQRAMTHVCGTDVHWAEMGEGPPLILLHGLTDSYQTWRLSAPKLAKSYRVLMPDLPGHGLSGRPDVAYEMDWFANVLGAWMTHVGVEKADIVGHSFGGGVAQWFARDNRHRIRRLALVSPGGLGREVLFLLRIFAAGPSALDPIGQPLMAAGTRIAMPIAGKHFTQDDIAHLSWMNSTPGTAMAIGRTVRNVISWRGQIRTIFDEAHSLGDLPPVAVFWGDKDPVVPAHHGERMARSFEGVEYHKFTDCGHYPHREHPDEFVEHLTSFLSTEECLPARYRAPAPRQLPGVKWLPQKATHLLGMSKSRVGH